ncbi:MAG: galactokinase [Alphaproteobacteria bacterium]|jgi:galactokinase
MTGEGRGATRFATPAQDPRQMADRFRVRFGSVARLFRAPGRINIIGEHTDYSGGFAAPAAIDRACLAAAAANTDRVLRISSLTLEETVERPLDGFERTGHWSDYVASVAAALASEGRAVEGCDLLLASDVPIGAGVSSSAALTVSTAMALMAASGLNAAPEDVRRVAWRAENQFAGVPCGPLDQFASVFGKKNRALLLDCRSLTASPMPAPPNTAFVLIDSGVKHRLSDGAYEQRRRECEEAAAALGLASLRDADIGSIEPLHGDLQRRARHVVTENARTLLLAAAFARGDCIGAGALMVKSHESLRADFEVTCAETDALASIANATPGVYGARQMGGGFGGCVIAFVDSARAGEAGRRISATYVERGGVGGDWFACALSDGAGEVRL